MKTCDKLTLLESMYGLSALSDDNQQLVFKMCCDQNEEVRMRAAELLAKFPSNDVLNMLCSMLNDVDELVRAMACESLAYCDLDDHIELIIQRTKDSSPLVRGYAALCLADFQKKNKKYGGLLYKLFKSLLDQETDEWVKVALLRCLIVLENDRYVAPFFELLCAADYANQCFALTLLNELLDDGVVLLSSCWRNELINIFNKNSSLAVRDKITKILEQGTHGHRGPDTKHRGRF